MMFMLLCLKLRKCGYRRYNRAWVYDSTLGLVFAGGLIENEFSISDKVERSLDNGETFSELPSLPSPFWMACLAVVYNDLGSD